MECISSCLKVFIIFLNFLLLIVSICFVVFGILFHTGTELSFLKSLELETKANIRNLMINTNIGDVDNVDKFSFTDLLGGWVAHAVIGVGFGLFVLSFSGCCGAWYKVRCFLLIYTILLGIVMIVEALVFALMFTVPVTIQGQIKRELRFTLTDYTGLAGDNKATLGWNLAMDHFKCCGIESYDDFKDHSSSWDRTPGTSITTPIDAPLVCCKTLISGSSNSDAACAREANLDVYDEGCFDKIWDSVLEKSLYTYVIFGNIFLMQILVFISAIIFYKDAKKVKQVYPTKPIIKKRKR